MTPGARTQAAIELIARIDQSWQSEKRIPADKLLDSFFRSHRYIGSKDRGAISELVYWVLRHKAALEWWLEREKHPRDAGAMVFAALVLRREHTLESLISLTKDSKYSPPALLPEEKRLIEALQEKHIFHPDMPAHVGMNYPEWLDRRLRERFGSNFQAEMLALNEQAPTDLRVNTLKTTRDALQAALAEEGFAATPTKLSPVGLRLEKRAPIFTSAYFKQGHFEVQDEGSQLVALLAAPQPGQRVIDFCAGAGGKTLAMAAAMKNKGRILAWDTSAKRLEQIHLRLRRAGADNVQTHVLESENDTFLKRHKGTADIVLVDAPCSGTGTWRRNPDLKWRFNETDLEELLAVQHSILMSAARLVKPGGKLVYATCSVLTDENEAQAEKFLKEINHFAVVSPEKIWDKTGRPDGTTAVPYLRVTPHQDGVDGFFAAVFERQAQPATKEP